MKKKLLVLLLFSTTISYSKKWSDLIPRIPHPPCENKTITKMWFENNNLGSRRNYRMKLVKLEGGDIWITFDTKDTGRFKRGVKMNRDCSLKFAYLATEKRK